MNLVFDQPTHTYTLDGEPVPSVTTILREAGLLQLDAVPPVVLETARTRGTAVHALLHYFNEDDLDESSVADEYQPYLEAWKRYRDERDLVVRLCEYRIASRRHRVAGTLDVLCSIDPDGWLIDFATGDPATVAKPIQTAGYVALSLEWAASDPRLAAVLARHTRWRRGALQLRSDASFESPSTSTPLTSRNSTPWWPPGTVAEPAAP